MKNKDKLWVLARLQAIRSDVHSDTMVLMNLVNNQAERIEELVRLIGEIKEVQEPIVEDVSEMKYTCDRCGCLFREIASPEEWPYGYPECPSCSSTKYIRKIGEIK